MELNPRWTYREFMKHIRQIRKEYILTCQNFDNYHLHDRVIYRTNLKRIIYDYPYSETRRNDIWRYLNKRYFILMDLKGGNKNE